MTEKREPSKAAWDAIAACRAAHFWEGLCPECVDAYTGDAYAEAALQAEYVAHTEAALQAQQQVTATFLRAALAQANQEIANLCAALEESQATLNRVRELFRVHRASCDQAAALLYERPEEGR